MKLSEKIFVPEDKQTKDNSSIFEDFGITSDEVFELTKELSLRVILGPEKTKTGSLAWILDNSELVKKLVEKIGIEASLIMMGFVFRTSLELNKKSVDEINGSSGQDEEKKMEIMGRVLMPGKSHLKA